MRIMRSGPLIRTASKEPIPMPQRKLRRGFTLIELMVVIVILGIIGTMGFVFLMDKPDDARWEAAKTELGEIHKALDLFKLDNQDYPASLEELQPKYMKKVPTDPWTKEAYQYEPTEDGFRLVCLGKDKAEGGDAKPNKDIVWTEGGWQEDD
jgi:general secretion pathway protein G